MLKTQKPPQGNRALEGAPDSGAKSALIYNLDPDPASLLLSHSQMAPANSQNINAADSSFNVNARSALKDEQDINSELRQKKLELQMQMITEEKLRLKEWEQHLQKKQAQLVGSY